MKLLEQGGRTGNVRRRLAGAANGGKPARIGDSVRIAGRDGAGVNLIAREPRDPVSVLSAKMDHAN